PPPMMPEILIRCASDRLLQFRRERRREPVDRDVDPDAAIYLHTLEMTEELAGCETYAVPEEERRTRAQREQRRAPVRGRGPAEERDEHARATRVLVRDERHDPPFPQRAQRELRCAPAVDRPHPEPLARLAERAVEERVRLPLH